MKKLLFGLMFLLSFGKSISQVNPQTGSATLEVPIFNFQDNISNLSLPVALNYNSGFGLKVDEVSSDVGQGWGLMAGGKIVRLQVGEPDDQKAYGEEGVNELSSNNKKYPAGYLYTTQNPQNGTPESYQYYPVFEKKNQLYRQHNILNADRELDYFLLNVNGISATFVLKKGTNEGVFLGSTLMKVTFLTAIGDYQTFTQNGQSYKVRTLIKSFIITDGSGIEYVFETMAYTKVTRLTSSDRRYQIKYEEPKKYEKRKVYFETYFDDNTIENPYIVNEWHLTSIRDKSITDVDRKVELTYAYRSLTMWTGFDYNTVVAKKQYAKAVAKKATVVIPVVTSISCPNHYNINFTYGAERLDLPGCQKLSAISVTYNGRYVQRHLLKQTYVIYTRYGTPVTEEQKLASRLYLLGVTRQTADLKDEDKPQLFDYYLGGSNNADFVPPPFFASKDAWGYFDGYLSLVGSGGSISPGFKSFCVVGSRGDLFIDFPSFQEIERLSFKDGGITSVKNGYAKNGLLKSVQYPAGGLLEYEYEQNKGKFYSENNEAFLGGVHVSKTTLFDGGYSNNCTNQKGIVTQYLYKNEDGSSSLRGAERPLNVYTSESEYKPYEKKYKFKPWKPLGGITCDYKYQYPGIIYNDQAVSVGGLQKLLSTPTGTAISAAISVYSTISNALSIAAHTSEASVAMAWAGLILDVLTSIFDFVMSCLVQDNTKTSTVTTWFNKDLNAINPLPMLYKRVEILQNNGDNGKTVTEYTSIDDYAPWVTSNPLFNMQQRYGTWLYGHTKRTVVYSGSGKKIKEVRNVYQESSCSTTSTYKTGQAAIGDMASVSSASTANRYRTVIPICQFGKIPLNMMSCNILTTYARPSKSIDWDTYNQNISYSTNSSQDVRVGIYDVYTGKVVLESSTEYTYQQEDDTKFLSEITSYEYDPLYVNRVDILLPKSIEKISPDGISTLEIFNYNNYSDLQADASENAALTKLLANNIYTNLISKKTFVKNAAKNQTQYLYTSIERNGYNVTPSGSVMPKKTYLTRAASPQSYLSQSSEKTVAQNYYDNEGLLFARKDEGERTIQYLNDYDGQMTVATIVNAAVNETVAYSSFETGNNHGFTFSGNTATGTCITGTKYAAVTSSTPVTATLTAVDKPYILSFWATVPITTSVGTLNKTGPLRKGYTYYEYNIPANTTTITLTGTASLDELRLYPARARMSTVSYDPLVGKTGECDFANRFTTYQYDNRARLKIIKDEYDNIVKMYEYNEKQETEKCPASYKSHAVYQQMRRNNCAEGSVGGYAEFTLAAGAFTSSISQEHADLLAQRAVDAQAQQSANSIAGCIPIFRNLGRSETFYSDDCGTGQQPGAYVYTVPANKYTSTISQEDATDQQEDEINDYGQTYADRYGPCSTTTEPIWEANEPASTQCQSGNLLILMTDINPNSSTYNQTQWKDSGPSENCAVSLAPVNYSNYTNENIYVEFTNVSTNNVYQFTLSSVQINSIAGQIPTGTYNVYIYSSNVSTYYDYSIAYYVEYANSVSISNLGIYQTGANIIIQY